MMHKIWILFLWFVVHGYCSYAVLDNVRLQNLIASDSEIMLLAEFSMKDQKTYAYTIPKERYHCLLNANYQIGITTNAVDLFGIVKRCTEYARSALNDKNEMSRLRMTGVHIAPTYVASNTIWYVCVGFTTMAQDGGSGHPLPSDFGVYALFDGEVVIPRVTDYTRYLDMERGRLLKARQEQ